ncbi:MAG: hypothetical protein AAFU59_13420 [Pseudomonadota bacterium]
MLTRLKTLALAGTCLTLASCDGELRSVEGHLSRSAQPDVMTVTQELAAEIPNPSDRLTLVARTWKPAGNGVYTGRNRTFVNATRQVYESDFRNGLQMDVIAEFDLSSDVPLYRFKLDFVGVDGALLLREKPQMFRAMANVIGSREAWRMQLDAPIGGPVPATIDAEGRIVTPWVFCPDCIANSDTSTARGQRALNERIQQLRARESGDWPEFGTLDFERHAIRGTVGPTAKGQAEAFGSTLAAYRSEAARSDQANRSYAAFFREIHDPLKFENFATASGCDRTYYAERYPYYESIEENREIIAENEAFIACYERAIDAYDFQGYTDLYPDLKAREAALWAASFGIERQSVREPTNQLTRAERRIEGAARGADDARDAIGEINRNIERRRAERAQLNALFAQTQSIIDQQSALTAANRQRISNTIAAASNAPRSVSTRRPVDAATPSQAIQTARSRLNSEVARVPVAAPTGTAPTSVQVEQETDVATIERLSGGMFACVGVVDTSRKPGSSPHSSCSYDTPDREALYITFANRCGVPVNVNMSLAMDTGENAQRSESNIRPGGQRTTVGFCGATNYTFTFEETLSSVRARGG